MLAVLTSIERVASEDRASPKSTFDFKERRGILAVRTGDQAGVSLKIYVESLTAGCNSTSLRTLGGVVGRQHIVSVTISEWGTRRKLADNLPEVAVSLDGGVGQVLENSSVVLGRHRIQGLLVQNCIA